MIGSNASKPFAEDFAEMRAYAITALHEARAKCTVCAELIAKKKAEIDEIEAARVGFSEIEDNLLSTLAKLERYARGEFEETATTFDHE